MSDACAPARRYRETSFVRSGPPGGWPLGSIYTSAQANQLDIDHANALDKTVAGDTLSGAIGMATTASIVVGISSGAQGMSGAFASGSIGFGTAPGTTQPALASGVSFGIISAMQGSFGLAGGTNDYPAFCVVSPGAAPTPTTRGRTISAPPLCVGPYPSGWAADSLTGYGLVNTSGSGGTGFTQPIAVHNGATLVQVLVAFAVGVSHHPVSMPQVAVFRMPISPNASPPAAQYLSSTPSQSMVDPGTGALYYANGNLQSYSYVCNQHQVIDTTTYWYGAAIADESGSGFMNGNLFFGCISSLSNIGDMRFQ